MTFGVKSSKTSHNFRVTLVFIFANLVFAVFSWNASTANTFSASISFFLSLESGLRLCTPHDVIEISRVPIEEGEFGLWLEKVTGKSALF